MGHTNWRLVLQHGQLKAEPQKTGYWGQGQHQEGQWTTAHIEVNYLASGAL